MHRVSRRSKVQGIDPRTGIQLEDAAAGFYKPLYMRIHLTAHIRQHRVRDIFLVVMKRLFAEGPVNSIKRIEGYRMRLL